jgi:hypothetical protein
MNAREVDEASARLRELRHVEWEDLGLASLAFALALAATQLRPALAVPLFLGGLAVGALGIRAMWRHWDLVDRLAGEREAYAISDVLEYASRAATMESRASYAAVIRSWASWPGPGSQAEAELEAALEELEELASELDDEELALDPAHAVACKRLVSDFDLSPLLNPAFPPEELRTQIRRIRGGFTPCRPAA